MMKTNQINQKMSVFRPKNIFSFVLLALFVQGLWSCNKDFDQKYIFKNTKDTTLTISSNKVLYIILTGARGQSIEATNTPKLNLIKNNANYSFQSVSDDNGLDATTWADMLTGVTKVKHNILSNDFAGNKLSTYPMFFKYIKQNTTLRTAAFTASNAITQQLVSNANLSQNYLDDDNAVKNATLTELGREDAGVVLAEFNGIDKAGAQYGYDSSISQYQTAIQTTDAYIGELVAKLGTRANILNENWLVIIASNRGGAYPVPPSEDDGTLFSKPLLNNYVMFYNPRFKQELYEKPITQALPYEGNAVNFSGTTTRAVLSADQASIFNFGNNINDEYTVEFKLKVSKFGSGSAEILSKNTNPYIGTDSYSGWWVIQNGGPTDNKGRWRFGGSGGGLTIATSSLAPALELQRWYTIGFKIYKESGKRWLKLYQDGEPASAAVDITSKNFINSHALTAGFIGGNGDTPNQNITDIRLFKAALPDNVIKEYSCQFDIPPTHPNYGNLIGYWSGIDGVGTMMKDKISGTRSFTIGGTVTWAAFQDSDPKFCIPFSTEIYKQLPRGVDIPKYIFSWLKVRTNTFNLDGKTWLPSYQTVTP